MEGDTRPIKCDSGGGLWNSLDLTGDSECHAGEGVYYVMIILLLLVKMLFYYPLPGHALWLIFDVIKLVG